MEYTNKEAYEKLIRARTVLLISQPFFGCLALHMNLVELPPDSPMQFRTMAVDGTNMYYFPEFVLKTGERELTGVVAHEVMHCAYQHMTRRQHRNPVIWNFAGDYVINDCLLKAQFELPKERLFDKKFEGMSTEEVYERIKEDVQKQLKKQAQGKGKGQKGKGQGKPEYQDDGEGTIYMPDTDLDTTGCGGVIDAAAPGEKHKQDQVQREWDANVRMAVNVAKRANAGNTPGYLERLVSQLKEPRVSWRELTRQFIDQSMSKDYSWQRPARHGLALDMYLPGFVSDSLHHMIFVVDTSGSISEQMLHSMVSEIGGALNDGTADKLTVVYADTDVRHVDEWMPGDLITAKMHGGGGTCFNDSFKWIKENAADAQCIVYLTDMMTSSFGEDVGIPTLWAAYLPHAMLLQVKPPFGTVIAVDTSE